jgi:hypothetical protein
MSVDPSTGVKPLEGKTYSLRGGDPDSRRYYDQIRAVADELIRQVEDPAHLLAVVRRLGRRRRHLKMLLTERRPASPEASLLQMLKREFSPYTTNVASHLGGLSLRERWDRTLSMSEQQYHLCMVEVELVNRLNVAAFRACPTRLAFLPHCLHDLNVDCRSAVRGEDYVCKGCSQQCGIRAVSRLLRRHGVTPYIWMNANLQSLLARLRRQGSVVGIVGIACIGELVRGMRLCMRADVPVIGLPLDANRCARWWGDFRPNSVNGRELENLLGTETELRPAREARPATPQGRSPAQSA